MHALAPGRSGYVQVARGRFSVNGHELGAALTGEPNIRLAGLAMANALVFDLP